MADKKPALKEYMIGVFVKAWVDVPVLAESLENALVKANELKGDRIFKAMTKGTNDYNHKIIQVYDPNFDLEA